MGLGFDFHDSYGLTLYPSTLSPPLPQRLATRMSRLWNLSLTALLASGQFLSTVVAQYASPTTAGAALTTLTLSRSTAAGYSSMTTATPTSSREPQVHTIKAGAGGFSFTPQETQVPPGDIVTFECVFTSVVLGVI